MRDSDWEDLMRSKAILSAENGSAARLQGQVISVYNQGSHNGIQLQNIVKTNAATSNFALSCEHFLKAATMYYHLKNSVQLRRSSNQLDVVNTKITQYLKNPDRMRSEFPDIDAALNAMSASDLAGGGHGLFTYYQIQTPVIKTLINHEFLSADSYDPDKQFSYIDLGILTRDFIKEGPDGQLYLPQDLLENYRKYSNSFVNDRYVATHNNPATQQDLENLNILSAGLEKIMCHCFPETRIGGIDFNESRLEKEIGSSIASRFSLARHPNVNAPIQSLDKANSFYLKNDFNSMEFSILLRSLDSIDRNRAINNIDKEYFKKMYLNLCIYMKHASVLQQTNIMFDERVFKRIEHYTRLVINPNLFNANGLQLKNTIFFRTHKSELEEELRNRQENSRSETDEPSMSEYVNEIIDNWDEYENDMGWRMYIDRYTNRYVNKDYRNNWIEFRNTMFNKLFKELKDETKYDSARDEFLDFFMGESNIFLHTAVRSDEEVTELYEDLIEFVNNADSNRFNLILSDIYNRSILNSFKDKMAFTMFIEEKDNPKYEAGRQNLSSIYPELGTNIEEKCNVWVAGGFSLEQVKKILCTRFDIFYMPPPSIEEKIKEITSNGFSKEEAIEMISNCPLLINSSPSDITRVKELYDQIGSAQTLVSKPSPLIYDPDCLIKRYQYYKNKGVTIDCNNSDILLKFTPEERNNIDIPENDPKVSKTRKQ